MGDMTGKQYASAIAELEKAGIVGSDALTAFIGACVLIGESDYLDWLDQVALLSPDQIMAEYGHDAGRAVIVLSRAHAAHDNGPDCD
jgi:hypothetical protein